MLSWLYPSVLHSRLFSRAKASGSSVKQTWLSKIDLLRIPKFPGWRHTDDDVPATPVFHPTILRPRKRRKWRLGIGPCPLAFAFFGACAPSCGRGGLSVLDLAHLYLFEWGIQILQVLQTVKGRNFWEVKRTKKVSTHVFSNTV